MNRSSPKSSRLFLYYSSFSQNFWNRTTCSRENLVTRYSNAPNHSKCFKTWRKHIKRKKCRTKSSPEAVLWSALLSSRKEKREKSARDFFFEGLTKGWLNRQNFTNKPHFKKDWRDYKILPWLGNAQKMGDFDYWWSIVISSEVAFHKFSWSKFREKSLVVINYTATINEENSSWNLKEVCSSVILTVHRLGEWNN